MLDWISTPGVESVKKKKIMDKSDDTIKPSEFQSIFGKARIWILDEAIYIKEADEYKKGGEVAL